MTRRDKIIIVLLIIMNCFAANTSNSAPFQHTESNNDFSIEFDLQKNLNELADFEDFTVSQKELRHYLSTGSYKELLNILSTKSDREMQSSDLLSLKIAALIGIKQFEKANIELQKLYTLNDYSEDDYLLVAKMYINADKMIEALKVCQKGIENNFESPKILFITGVANDISRKYPEALLYFLKADELNKKKSVLKNELLTKSLTNIYSKLQKIPQAGEAAGRAQKEERKSLVEMISLAKFAAYSENFPESLEILDTTIAKTKQIEPLIIKAQILNLAGKPAKAMEVLNELKKQTGQAAQPGSAEMTATLSYLLMDQPKEALSELNKYKKSNKVPPSINIAKATVFISLGDAESAAQALRNAPLPFAEMATHESLKKHLSPTALGPILGKAYYCLDQGYYVQAAEIAQKALSEFPENIFLHFLNAESFRRTEHHQQALAEFQKLAEIQPESLALRLILAQSYEDNKETAKAQEIYGIIAEERPDFLMAQLAYGRLQELSGQWEKARKTYEMALNFKPESASLLMSLGWTLVHLNDLEPLNQILRNLENKKRVPHYMIRHLEGWAAYQQKDFPRALSLLSQSMEGNPGDPELCYHLGMALYSAGQKQKAANLLKQAFLHQEQKEKYFRKAKELFPEL